MAPDRLEWYMNVVRIRHRVPAHFISLLGSGKSPNEATNASINKWLRNLGHVHAQNVKLELRVFQLGSILSQNSAMQRPTLAQVRQCGFLAPLVRGLEIPADVWASFGAAAPSHHLEEARKTTHRRGRKRASASGDGGRCTKRTAFTLLRRKRD